MEEFMAAADASNKVSHDEHQEDQQPQPQASTSIVHVPTAVRSLLPLPSAMLQMPSLPVAPRLSLGDHASPFQRSRVSGIGEYREGEGPSVIWDGNGRSFSVPARMGLSSSMELPGMSFEDSLASPSAPPSLFGAPEAAPASRLEIASSGTNSIQESHDSVPTSLDCSSLVATTGDLDSIPGNSSCFSLSSDVHSFESTLQQSAAEGAFTYESMDAPSPEVTEPQQYSDFREALGMSFQQPQLQPFAMAGRQNDAGILEKGSTALISTEDSSMAQRPQPSASAPGFSALASTSLEASIVAVSRGSISAVELVTTETESSPVDGTQSASAALMRNAPQSVVEPGVDSAQGYTVDQLFPSMPSCSGLQRSSKDSISTSQPFSQVIPSSKGLSTVELPSSFVSDLSPPTPMQHSLSENTIPPSASPISTADPADKIPDVPSLHNEKKNARKKKIIGEKEAESSEIPLVEEVRDMLEAQRKLVHDQLEDLQKLLSVQYSLTGVNPLFQEMASSVLGSKAVKKPEESLMPETLRFLRDVYAIKDTVTKKEARDLSILTGATRTQVREFFAGQQSRVKRLIQRSHEEVGRIDVHNAVEQSQVQSSTTDRSAIEKDTSIGSADSFEKLLDLMRSESSFTGQSRLVQIILQADHVPLLRLILDKGGLRILGKWLIQAAAEEQTSLVRQILKALFHLPMIHAIPAQVSPIVQTVNKLRFYFATDVASRARSLIARWSKLFARTGVGKILGTAVEPPLPKKEEAASQESGKQNSLSGSLQAASGPDRKKIKTEVASAESKLGVSRPHPLLNKPNLKGLHKSEMPSSSSNLRRSIQTIEDPALANQASKKRLAEHGKEKRRVVLVEEFSGTSRRIRDADGRRSSGMDKGSRPLSVDDIQKAKMRARLLQGSSAKANAKSRIQESLQQGIRSREVQVFSQNHNVSNPPEAVVTDSQAAYALPARQASTWLPESRKPSHTIQSQLSVPMASCAPIQGLPVALTEGVNVVSTAEVEAKDTVSDPMLLREDECATPKVDVTFVGDQGKLEAATRTFGVDEKDSSAVLSTTDNNVRQSDEAVRSDMEIETEGTSQSNSGKFRDKHTAEPTEELSCPLDASPKVLIAELLKRAISWTVPPKVPIDVRWSVATGEDSKEKEIQSARVKREVEEFYSDPDCIPKDPKDPWDEEQDYDDSLTLQVPLESDDGQQKDVTSQQVPTPNNESVKTSIPGSTDVPSHDPELLALLLRNPALVSELTSAQGLQALKTDKPTPVADNQLQLLQGLPTGPVVHSSQQVIPQQFQRGVVDARDFTAQQNPQLVRPPMDIPFRDYGGQQIASSSQHMVRASAEVPYRELLQPSRDFAGQQSAQYFSNAHTGSADGLLGQNPNVSTEVSHLPWNALDVFQGAGSQNLEQQFRSQRPGFHFITQQEAPDRSFSQARPPFPPAVPVRESAADAHLKQQQGAGGGYGGYISGSNFIPPPVRDFNANAMPPGGNPQVWNVGPNRVSNNNLSFAHGNQGLEMGLRPLLPPNNVDARFARPQSQTSWFNSSIQPRPGWRA